MWPKQKVVWVNKIVVPTMKFAESCLLRGCVNTCDINLFLNRLPWTKNWSHVEQALANQISCEIDTICRRNWNISTKVREVDDGEIEIIPFVTKLSLYFAVSVFNFNNRSYWPGSTRIDLHRKPCQFLKDSESTMRWGKKIDRVYATVTHNRVTNRVWCGGKWAGIVTE
jgi:hypothetical protein